MLFSQTELHQILKLPVLVQHYFEHKGEKDITLADFIVLHYFSGNLVDDDYARDIQLAFKTSDCIQGITSIVNPEQIVLSNEVLLISIKSFSKVQNDWIPSNYMVDIFRPPQFA